MSAGKSLGELSVLSFFVDLEYFLVLSGNCETCMESAVVHCGGVDAFVLCWNDYETGLILSWPNLNYIGDPHSHGCLIGPDRESSS